MAIAGAALRLWVTFLYLLAFGCSVVILGLYSYFLATLSTHNAEIKQYVRAVEGISGAGVLYTIFALFLTCFLGGLTFFAFLGIVLDVLFAAAFIAIAVMTRHGADSCSGYVRTPIGNGPAQSHIGFSGKTFSPRLRTACRLNKAAFAVSIIGIFMFLLAAVFQILLGRHHQKEKKYGPSPANNYTSGRAGGSRFKFFKRNRGVATDRELHNGVHKDAEAGVVGTNGTNGVHNAAATEPYPDRYETPATGGVPAAGGYHAGPTGTAVNPYGYEAPAGRY